MLSCWHDLLFLFCLILLYIFLTSMGWLCGVGIFGLIELSLSPGLAQRKEYHVGIMILSERSGYL